MSARLCIGLIVSCLLSTTAHSQLVNRYNYDRQAEMFVNAGMQALLTCNGLFVSNRTLEQLHQAELKMDRMPLAPTHEVTIDRERKAVAIGEQGVGPVMRAAYRDGLGCVLMGPEQTFRDIDRLPILTTPP